MARALRLGVVDPFRVSAFPVRQGRGPGETRGDNGAGAHLFPFRTEKLSPAATMILRESVGK